MPSESMIKFIILIVALILDLVMCIIFNFVKKNGVATAVMLVIMCLIAEIGSSFFPFALIGWKIMYGIALFLEIAILFKEAAKQ